MKLIRDEPASGALRSFLEDADVITCELVLSEVPRAVRRAAALDPSLPIDLLLARAGEILEALALLSLDRGLLAAAGALAEPALRTLDTIHVAAAVALSPIDALVSYDERQSAAGPSRLSAHDRPRRLRGVACGPARRGGQPARRGELDARRLKDATNAPIE